MTTPVGEGFPDQVVGGTTLIRPAIKSPDYVPGTSGWSINRDGSAEFNNLSIRGVFNGTDYVINSSGMFIYSGPAAFGNLVASVANGNGTDDEGNAYIGPGPAAYSNPGPNSFYAVLIAQAFTAYYFATSAAGPWMLQGAVRGDITTGVLTLQAASNVETQVPLALDNISAPATPTGAAWLYGGTGHAKYAGTDGGYYNTGQATLYKTAAQTISTTSFTAVTWANGGPTFPVAAGAYRLEIYGSYLEGAAAGTPIIELTGPATSNVELLTEVFSVAGAAAVLTNRTTTLATSITLNTMNTLTRIFSVKGLIVFTAPGSLELLAATSAAADTWNIQAGTYFTLIPVT